MTKNEKLTEENASLKNLNAAIRVHAAGTYEAIGDRVWCSGWTGQGVPEPSWREAAAA
jgi:hypothetical protein